MSPLPKIINKKDILISILKLRSQTKMLNVNWVNTFDIIKE